jgi:hypothetical protein
MEIVLMRTSNSAQKVELLKSELTKVRHECLLATRQNDFRRIAQLSIRTAELNQALRDSLIAE